jgi:hypothetical protein
MVMVLGLSAEWPEHTHATYGSNESSMHEKPNYWIVAKEGGSIVTGPAY